MTKNVKTISVHDLVKRVNASLAVPDSGEYSALGHFHERKALIKLIESVLMDTGRYAGYRFLSEMQPEGHLAITHDETRRHYFIKPSRDVK